MINLYDFQINAVKSLKQTLLISTSVILCSATGSGKTYITSEFIKDYLLNDPSNKVLVLVGLQVLVVQNYESFIKFRFGVSVLHDLIKKDSKGNKLPFNCNDRVLLTMPETFTNTIQGSNDISPVWLSNWKKWEPNLIIIDESHKGTSTSYQVIRDMYPNAKILGVTATPYRADNTDGKSLYEWYGNNLVTTISVEELISIGILVKPKYIEEGSEYFTTDKWLDHTAHHSNKRSIIFTKDTSHSLRILESFTRAGISAEIITGGCEEENINPDTPLQRQEKFDNFNSGKTVVLISVNALCEGFDSPKVQFCFLLRDVKNKAIYHQIIGRAVRADKANNKTEAVIVDFYNNIERFGPIESYEWSIEHSDDVLGVSRKSKPIQENIFRKKRVIFYICDNCCAVYDTKKFDECPECTNKHNIKITNKLKTKLIEITGKISEKSLISLWNELKVSFEYYGNMGSETWNRAPWNVGKKEIFKHQKGGFLDEYKWLETALLESCDLKQDIVFIA